MPGQPVPLLLAQAVLLCSLMKPGRKPPPTSAARST